VSNDLYLGIDTGGTAMKHVLTNASGKVVACGEVPTLSHDPTASLKCLAAAVAGDLGGPDLPRLAAVGLACAGIINPDTGALGRSPNLPGWENSPLGQMVSEVFTGKPYAVANDVNGALYGEYCYGAGRGYKHLVMIALGTGVGGGVIVDGKLVVGSHCGAGEVGHMILDPNGPLCSCGGHGCLEAYAGSSAIIRSARTPGGEGAVADLMRSRGALLNTADLAKLATDGAAEAIAIFAEAGQWLGRAVANLVNILDPDLVIVGGGVGQAGDLILDPCRAVVPDLVLAAEAKNVPIVPAQLGNLAAAQGAASLARLKDLER
jgi:glucokinase